MLGKDGPDTNIAITEAFKSLNDMIAENRFEEIKGIYFWPTF